jgi:hypothetical protein
MSTETTTVSAAIAEIVGGILRDMDLPTAVHAMIPEYIDMQTYRVEREVLTFQGVWEGAQVACIVSTRHGRAAVTINITG